jgi:hypothetical protein
LTIFTATPESVDSLWSLALPHIERFAQETQLIHPADILEDIKTGAKQLWMMSDEGYVTLVVVTEVFDTAGGQVCTMRIACGSAEKDQLRNICAEIEIWAREIGCVAVEIWGRKGWSRVLEGFKESGVILEKDLRKVH